MFIQVISTLIKNMEALGWGPYQADHEDANGQVSVLRLGLSLGLNIAMHAHTHVHVDAEMEI